MKRHLTRFRSFLKDEDGATMVEYGILVALISVVSILVIVSVGLYVKGAFQAVETQMSGAGIAKGT